MPLQVFRQLGLTKQHTPWACAPEHAGFQPVRPDHVLAVLPGLDGLIRRRRPCHLRAGGDHAAASPRRPLYKVLCTKGQSDPPCRPLYHRLGYPPCCKSLQGPAVCVAAQGPAQW